MVKVNLRYENKKIECEIQDTLDQFYDFLYKNIKFNGNEISSQKDVAIFYIEKKEKIVNRVYDKDDYKKMIDYAKNNPDMDIYINLVKNIPSLAGELPVYDLNSYINKVICKNFNITKEKILKQLGSPYFEDDCLNNNKRTGEKCVICSNEILGHIYQNFVPGSKVGYICEKCAQKQEKPVIKIY